ncbi:MAG: VWA domain-containing protein, partial [Pyrinomonadaceae bacterium]
ILVLVCGMASSIFAQTSGGERTRRVETSPVPNASPQPSGDKSSNSNSTIKRQSKLPSFLGGGTSISNNSNSNSDVKPTQTTSAPTKAAQKPPVLVDSSGLPVPSQQTQTSSAPAASAETPNEEDEVIKVETELVTIPVTVLDREGRFMTGLQQSDFRISEDGKQQEIAYFNTTEQPFTVVLMIDVSNSTKFKIDEIQDAAIAFINQLKQNDRVMVISFDDNVNVLSEPTSDRRQLYDAIRRANFNGGTSLYDAVDFAVNRRLNRIEGRKAVVLFTDGVDTTSKGASYQSTVRDSEELDATIYPVYYNTYSYMQNSGGGNGGGNYPRRQPFPRRGGGGSGIGGIIGIILGGGNVQIGRGGSGGGTAGSSRSEYERGEQYLEDLAAKTGGRKYDADSTRNLSAAFSSIAEELRRQYSIGYYPTTTGNTGQRKQIKVSVNRPNSIVRARDSYIVGEQKPNSAKLNLGR